MKLPILLISGLLTLYPMSVGAQTEGVQSFGQPEGAWMRNANTQEKVQPQQRFVDDLGPFAIENIVKAEQIFCYEVFPQNDEYKGYTIDGFPIRGFCGVINEQVRDMVVEYFLSTKENVLFDQAEQCVVEPKIMFRFIRGVDHTDMLLSSPCHSFALFYGGSVQLYNYKPGAEIIDAMIQALGPKHSEFISPSLLNQVMPIGVIQNEQQRKIVNRRSEPIRKWIEKAQADELKKAEQEKKNKSGWNKLKTRSFAQPNN